MHFSPSLEQVVKLLKEGNIEQVDGSTDHFVQFLITTETDKETLRGNIYIYVTICANHELH